MVTFVRPVIFPPGRARLATSLRGTGSPPPVMTMGIVVERDYLVHEFGKPIDVTVGIT